MASSSPPSSPPPPPTPPNRPSHQPPPPPSENPTIAQLPWIQSPRVRNARKTTFIRVGDLSRCEPPSHFVRDSFLIARIHNWVLLQESIPSNTYLFNPLSHERMRLPCPPPQGRVTCTALLSTSPNDNEFWVVVARGNSIFGCRPRTGIWFLRDFECEFISMFTMPGGKILCCLLSDLAIAQYVIGPSTDHVRLLTTPSAASSVSPPSGASEHFVIHHDERQVLVVVVSYDLNWRPPAVVSFDMYFVDETWELIGPDAVRDHLLVLVNGGHSFSLRTPPGLRGTLAYLVPRPNFYRGSNLLWIVLDLERGLSFAHCVEAPP